MLRDNYRGCGLQVMFTVLVLLISGTAWAQDVPLYRLFETSVTNNNSYGNRFFDVDLDVTYTHPGTGKVYDFYGFFDGDGNGGGDAGSGNVWKMRFMPDELGTWNYTYTWSDSTPGGSGSFNCIAAGASPGIIKAYTPNPGWFAYNGTDPVYLKSYSIIPSHMITQDINQVAPKVYQKLVDRGYNHIQLAGLLPLSYKYKILEDCGPSIDAYLYSSGAPSSTMRLDIWHVMDQHMAWLNDRDVGVHFFQGFDGKELGPRWGSLSWSEKQFYVKYVCSRMAPLANICGFNFTFESEDGVETRELVDLLDQYDPWDHLRTHMQGTYTPDEFNDGWWDYHNYLFIAAEVITMDHLGPCAQSPWEVHEHMLAAWNAYDKPVFHSECWNMWRSCYNTCEDAIRRFAWTNAFTGAAATWTDLPFCDTGNLATDILSWENAATAVDIVADTMNNEIEFWKMSPHTGTTNQAIALHEPGRQYAAYKLDGDSFDIDMEAGNYDGKWINCLTGQQTTIGMVSHSGGSRSFTSPFGSTDSVIVLTDFGLYVPAAPSNLTATVGSDEQIDLSWLDNSGANSDEEDLFHIERQAAGEPGFVEVATLAGTIGTGSTLQYSDVGLNPLTEYCYRVSASNNNGFSGYTNEACDTTHAPGPPAPPTGLAASVADGKVTLDWNANTETEPAVLYYMVYRSTTQGGPYSPVAIAFGGTNIVDRQVLNDVMYYYVLKAVDTYPQQSDYSAEVSAMPHILNPPAAPSDLVATAISYQQIDLAWVDNSDNEDGFRVYRDDVAIDTTTGTTYNDIGLAASTTYSYKVVAYNVDGDSDPSNTDAATTQPPPPPPDNLVATAISCSQVDLTWNDNSDDEEGFRIYRDDVLIDTTTSNSYSDTSTSELTTYCYTVTAYNAMGETAPSNESCVTTPGCSAIADWIDDTDASITYTGTWGAQTGWGGRYMETIHESNDDTTPATAEMDFTGFEIALIADTQDYAGQINVYIDGELQGQESYTASTAYQVEIFRYTVPNGPHTIMIEHAGGGWIYIDAIEVVHY